MAFPQVASTAYDEDTSAVTTHNATIPTGTASGDLLVMIVGIYWPDADPFIAGMPAGWTQLIDQGADPKNKSEVWFKTSDGAEVDFTFTTDVAAIAKTDMLRITDWHGTTSPEAAGASDSGGTSTAPNPPSLSPSWGAEDTLWIAHCSAEEEPTFTSYPTNYTDNQFNDPRSNPVGILVARATRELNTATEDPGAFTIGEAPWAALTIAIRPAEEGGGGGGPTGTPAISEQAGPTIIRLPKTMMGV